MGGVRIGNGINGNRWGWGPGSGEAGSVSFPEPGRDLRGHGAWPLWFRGGEDEGWVVEWLRYRIVKS